MKKTLPNFIQSLILAIIGFMVFSESNAQTVVIASEGFNNSVSLFTSTSNLGFISGNSSTSQRPQSLPFESEGTHAGECANENTSMSTGNINTSAYCNVVLSLRLAAWSNNASNGVDGNDDVIVQISNDGGSTYRDILKVTGSSSNNSFWHYTTGSATATSNYATTVGAALFFPNGSGNRTSDGYSNLQITNLPSISNLRVRITLDCGSGERWTIDDFKITGELRATTPSVSISTPSFSICQGTSATFSSNISNGGSSPSYQWLLNGNPISGANSATYTSSSISNSNTISLRVTSNGNCSPSATSGIITMTVNSNVTPTASISVNNNNVCAGTSQTFSSSITNGGSSPSYQWTRNGSNISGATSSSYSSSSLSNGDVIGLILTSNANCRTANTATSSTITAQINSSVTPTVNISLNNNNVCVGTTQTFSSTITNGGSSPSYQWTRNGSNISGATSSSYSSSSLSNGDVIGLVLTSNANCRTSNSVSSSTITAQIQSNNTTVSISSNSTSICPNTSVTFNSNATNQGSNPSYSWRINGTAVNNNFSTLVIDTFTTSSTVSLVLSPSADACPSAATATSNNLALSVLPGQNLVVASATSNQICRGSSVQLNASAATTARFDTAFINGFESNQPTWTIENNSTGGSSSSRNGTSFTFRQSTYNYNGDDYQSNDNSRFVFANSENHSGATNVSIISPSFSTIGFSSANIDFFHYYNDDGITDFANVSISTNGTTWTSLQSYISDVASRTNFSKATIAIPAGFLNQSTVFVRFNYVTTGNEKYWAIDNVLVSGIKNYQPTFSWEDQNNVNVGNQANISNFSPNQSTNLTLTATNIFGCISSQNVIIQVDQPTQAGSISGSNLVCRGTNFGGLKINSKVGSIVKWQWSELGNVWNDLNNSTDSANFSNLTTQRQFRAEVKNGVCASSFTPNFPVNVKNKNWTGDFDNNWFDARNWCGGIPDSSEVVEIPGGKLRKPRLNGNLIIQDLISDDTLSIENYSFTLKGDLTGNGSF